MMTRLVPNAYQATCMHVPPARLAAGAPGPHVGRHLCALQHGGRAGPGVGAAPRLAPAGHRPLPGRRLRCAGHAAAAAARWGEGWDMAMVRRGGAWRRGAWHGGALHGVALCAHFLISSSQSLRCRRRCPGHALPCALRLHRPCGGAHPRPGGRLQGPHHVCRAGLRPHPTPEVRQLAAARGAPCLLCWAGVLHASGP